jgi:[ribosomal protein S5]-alanine N-acetyltransferase
MHSNLTTERLQLNPLALSDKAFIFELVNTPNWIKFIGDRNIHTAEDSINYIQKILDNPQAHYWVVNSKELKIPIGCITFIKRHYLDFYDIGFAFLPDFAKKGSAFEATKTVLDTVKADENHPFILATTLSDNVNSIQLLEKLGLKFDKNLMVGDDNLMLFSMINN